MEHKHVIGFIVGMIVIVGGIVFFTSRTVDTGPDLTVFAQCIKQSKAIFYGAFWCPHCQATKKMFGNAQKELPYVECSTADSRGQTQICIDKGIKSYPTWEFADGTRATGELTLQQLSERTSCSLPDAVAPASTTATSTPAASSSSSVVVPV